MSLINKMLQDLDARGTPGAEPMQAQIRPVARGRIGVADRVDARTLSLAIVGVCAAGAVAALGWFGWTHYMPPGGAAKPLPSVAAKITPKPAAVASQPGQGMSSTIRTAPVTAANLAAPEVVPAPPAAPAGDRFDAPPAPERVRRRAAASAPVAAPAAAPASAPKSVAGYEPDSEEARAARQAIMLELQSRLSASVPRPALAPARGRRAAQGVQESGAQRAESAYRHALEALQDGRMTEAVAALEQALKLDAGHEAARQTLVGLLIEAKRGDEAIRHLQAGLALDPRQPSMAMLLARLQIERGASGIDTLTRTLPYAGNNADYHAFLAGALQREQRHREAAEQYLAALRVAPANGVWWMGLGMSLQADKRNAEALDAFQRARASGMLSAELAAFVERRVQQLGR